MTPQAYHIHHRTIPQRVYLNLLCAEDHPEQCPEFIAAHWGHLLFMLVPIIGILLFTTAVREAGRQ